MITKILIVLAILLVAFLVIAALQPSTFRITRSTTISAAPAVIFAQVNDLRKWQAWSPWEKMIGGQFEKGLADLKTLTEAAARG